MRFENELILKKETNFFDFVDHSENSLILTIKWVQKAEEIIQKSQNLKNSDLSLLFFSTTHNTKAIDLLCACSFHWMGSGGKVFLVSGIITLLTGITFYFVTVNSLLKPKTVKSTNTKINKINWQK